jgi:hypothetical protein
MLLQNLRRIARKCCVNPRKPSVSEGIFLDVGNPTYWETRAAECMRLASLQKHSSHLHIVKIEQAISLLLLSRAYTDEEVKRRQETRERSSKQNSESPKDS